MKQGNNDDWEKDLKKRDFSLKRSIQSEAKIWSPENFFKVKLKVDEKCKALLKHPDVIGYAFGPKEIEGSDLDTLEIKIWVKWMHPKEVEKLKLPSELAGYKTSVRPAKIRSTGMTNCPDMDDAWYGPLRPGINVGDLNNCGSLGMIVWRGTSASFLTAWHVVGSTGTITYQPGGPPLGTSSPDACGHVINHLTPISLPTSTNQAEVSLVEINMNRRSAMADPHAEIYPYPPTTPGLPLNIKGASRALNTYEFSNGFFYGYGYGIQMNFRGVPFTMGDTVVALPNSSNDETFTAAGNSGSVLYDDNGAPISIIYGHLTEYDPNVQMVLDFCLSSPLNAYIPGVYEVGIDILSTLNVTNIAPTPETQPPSSW